MTQYLFRCIVFGKREDGSIWSVVKNSICEETTEEYGEKAKECGEAWTKGLIGYVVIDLERRKVITWSGFSPDEYEVKADLIGVDASEEYKLTKTRELLKELSKLDSNSVQQAITVWEAQQKLNSINAKRTTLLKKIKDSLDKSLMEMIFDD